MGPAFRVINALARLDVGQAAVVAKGHVLAVEAAVSTDAMLVRCAELRPWGERCHRERVGVLVKAPKSGQDERVDVPADRPEDGTHGRATRPCRHCRRRGLRADSRARPDYRRRQRARAVPLRRATGPADPIPTSHKPAETKGFQGVRVTFGVTSFTLFLALFGNTIPGFELLSPNRHSIPAH